MAQSIKEVYEQKRKLIMRVLAGDEEAIIQFNRSYDAAVARFMKLKETVIEKVYRGRGFKRYDLYFDMQNSRKLIWDILFLAEIIKYECSLDDDRSKKLKESLASKYSKVKFSDASISALLNDPAMKSVNFDETQTLEQVLKEAICIFDSIRNSFGHNAQGVSCNYDEVNDKVNIKNDLELVNGHISGNYMDASIDFSYFADFGCGIKPLEEHSNIKEVVDYNNAEIFRKLGFRIKDNLDIFYRTSPSRFNFLLELVGNNYDRLVNLPPILFSSCVEENRIVELLGVPSDFDRLTEIPGAAFSSKCTKKRLLELCRGRNFCLSEEIKKKGIDDYIKTQKFSDSELEILKKLPSQLFLCSDVGLEIYYYLIDNGVDFNDLKNYPSKIFLSAGITLEKIKYFVELDGGFDAGNLVYLNDKILNGECSLDNIKEIISKKEDLIYISTLSDMPKSFWTSYSFKYVISLLFEYSSDWKLFLKLPNIVFTPECLRSRLQLLLKYFSVDELSFLPEHVFSSKYENKKIEWFINNCKDYNLFANLPVYVYDTKNELLSLYIGDECDFSRLSQLPKGMYNWNVNLKILKYIFDIPFDDDKQIVEFIFSNSDCLSALNNFPESIFTIQTPEQLESSRVLYDGILSFDEFQPYFDADFWASKERFNILEIIIGEPKNYLNLCNLNWRIFSSAFSYDKIRFLFENGNGIEILNQLYSPKYESIADIVLGPYVSLDVLLLVSGGKLDFDILSSVPKAFLTYCSFESIKYMLELVDNGRNLLALNQFPTTMFRNVDVDKIYYFVGKEKNYRVLFKVPEFCFDERCSLDRIKTIMEKINNDYEVLNKLPKEVFVSNGLVDDLVNDYSDVFIGIQKSIFGLNDDKLISLIIYLNSLLSISTKDKMKDKKLNIACFDFAYIQDFDKNLLNSAANEISDKLNDCFNDTGSFIQLLEKYSYINQFEDAASLSVNELNMKFEQWEDGVRTWLFSSVFDVCGKLYNSTRNSAEHVRIICTADGKLLVCDEINKVVSLNDGSTSKIVQKTFSATVEPDKLFSFASSIQDRCFDDKFELDSTSEQNIIKNIILNSDVGMTEEDFNKMYDAYVVKINDFIESVRRTVMNLCNLKQKNSVITDNVVYIPSSVGSGLSYDNANGITIDSVSVAWNDTSNNEDVTITDDVEETKGKKY